MPAVTIGRVAPNADNPLTEPPPAYTTRISTAIAETVMLGLLRQSCGQEGRAQGFIEIQREESRAYITFELVRGSERRRLQNEETAPGDPAGSGQIPAVRNAPPWCRSNLCGSILAKAIGAEAFCNYRGATKQMKLSRKDRHSITTEGL
jgi:hypothetical protein